LNLQAPVITFETDLRTSNLKQILKNLDETTRKEKWRKARSKKKRSREDQRVQVDELVIAGAQVRVSLTSMQGNAATVPIPDIRMRDLGTEPEGITVAELTRKVFEEILERASAAASERGSEVRAGSSQPE
jgi:hypothetical protein